MLSPRLGDRGGRRVAHFIESRPVVDAPEEADRGLNIFAARGGVGLDTGDDFAEQSPGAPPFCPQLVVGLGLGESGDGLHLRHGGLDVRTGHLLKKHVSPSIERQSIVGQNQQTHRVKQHRCTIEIAQAAQAVLPFGGFCALDHVRE